ncbi:Uncharacterised protein [Candidatus Anstonella stagnisolia]|nr:Uncharacterised protein [Candidatus Anstonella stagnisolia]
MGIVAPSAIAMRKPVVVSMPFGKERVHLAVLRSWREGARFFEMPLLLEGINLELGINAKLLSPCAAQELADVNKSGKWKEFGDANKWQDFWYLGFPAATGTLVAHGKAVMEDRGHGIRVVSDRLALGSPISNLQEGNHVEMVVPGEYRLKKGVLVAREIEGRCFASAGKGILITVPSDKLEYVERGSHNLVERVPAHLLSCKEDVEVKLAAEANISPIGLVQVAGPVIRLLKLAADFSAGFRFALVVQVGEEDAKVLRN